MFDDLLDLFNRRKGRANGDRPSGLRGVIDSLTGDHDDDHRDRPDRGRRRYDDDDHDDDDDGFDRRRGDRAYSGRRDRDGVDID